MKNILTESISYAKSPENEKEKDIMGEEYMMSTRNLHLQ